MTSYKSKLVVCSAWTILILALVFFQDARQISSQVSYPRLEESTKIMLRPEKSMVDLFDAAIQKRFLTAPNFGIARIASVNPPNPHLSYFNPIGDDETSSVRDFEKDGWKVSLHLFGRRASPKEGSNKNPPKFSINYKLNKALPVTSKLSEKQLPKAKKLLTEVKAAFVEFQTPDSPQVDNYEFTIGDWSYVAKPIRAANQSCLQCHTDYVITAKIGDDQYRFRKRAVGDANGVIVYGFTKKD